MKLGLRDKYSYGRSALPDSVGESCNPTSVSAEPDDQDISMSLLSHAAFSTSGDAVKTRPGILHSKVNMLAHFYFYF